MNTSDLITKYGFTIQEKIIFEWQFDMMGGFERSLMEAFCRADDFNLIKLGIGFPDHAQAYHGWSRGNLRDQLAMKMDEKPEVFERFRI